MFDKLTTELQLFTFDLSPVAEIQLKLPDYYREIVT
jgi:hypothetical protein